MSNPSQEEFPYAYVTPAQYQRAKADGMQRETVFGNAYIDEMVKQPATQETTEAFITTVDTLTSEHPREMRGDALLLLGSKQDHPVRVYVPGAHPHGDVHMDTRIAAVENITEHLRLMKPTNYPIGWYTERDSIYVESRFRHARVVRQLVGGLVLGPRHAIQAETMASEPLMQRALNSIAAAALRSSQH